LSLVAIPTTIPTGIRNSEFAGAFGPVSRMMMTEDAKFALGF
jgi:hypothetical protein